MSTVLPTWFILLLQLFSSPVIESATFFVPKLFYHQQHVKERYEPPFLPFRGSWWTFGWNWDMNNDRLQSPCSARRRSSVTPTSVTERAGSICNELGYKSFIHPVKSSAEHVELKLQLVCPSSIRRYCAQNQNVSCNTGYMCPYLSICVSLYIVHVYARSVYCTFAYCRFDR